MGTRSITAPLSPNEELTLRRIAIGIAEIDELHAADVVRLSGIGLLDDAKHLTPAGWARCESLARHRGPRVSAALRGALQAVARKR